MVHNQGNENLLKYMKTAFTLLFSRLQQFSVSVNIFRECGCKFLEYE